LKKNYKEDHKKACKQGAITVAFFGVVSVCNVVPCTRK